MGLFVLPNGNSREDLLACIRANLDLYERQCHDWENSYLLECFVQQFLNDLIELDKKLPTNYEYNEKKSIEANIEKDRKCPKCGSYKLSVKIIDKTKFDRLCQDCDYHGSDSEFNFK